MGSVVQSLLFHDNTNIFRFEGKVKVKNQKILTLIFNFNITFEQVFFNFSVQSKYRYLKIQTKIILRSSDAEDIKKPLRYLTLKLSNFTNWLTLKVFNPKNR